MWNMNNKKPYLSYLAISASVSVDSGQVLLRVAVESSVGDGGQHGEVHASFTCHHTEQAIINVICAYMTCRIRFGDVCVMYSGLFRLI